MDRDEIQGCMDIGVIVDREWYWYFSRELDNKHKWHISDDEDDKKPAACPKKDDDDVEPDPTDSAMSLLILPYNSFGQGGDVTQSPTNYFSRKHAQLVALQSVPEAPSIAVTWNLPHTVLPIGQHSTAFSVKTCVDSCAGINLGDYNFHMAISRLYPEAVAQFTDLTES